jgi:hypothetical protein
MICRSDLVNLWNLRREEFAVMVVKHNYRTKSKQKYLGNKNEDYPRKIWSSLILWNCAHPKNASLTTEFVERKEGAFLHRFAWLEESEIGALQIEWNWLATEYEDNPNAHLIHYTLGTPCFRSYQTAPMSSDWHSVHQRSQQGMGD